MVRKVKYGKILVVVFITVLIWVWADLAKTEEFTVSSATITVAKSTNISLLVSFNDEQSVSIEKIVLEGPASKIADTRRELEDGSLSFEFFLDPEQQDMAAPGKHSLDMLNFLRRSTRVRQSGLAVKSCDPNTLDVRVVKLVKKSLNVKCVGEDQGPVRIVAIEPPQVDIFVPADWEGEKLTANVQLTRREIEQAKLTPIEKTPYVKLPVGQTRYAATAVKITTPKEEDPLGDYTITTATLGFSLSANLQGKYRVEVTNPDAVMSAVTIRATPEAKSAYESMRYQVILEIDDEDAKTPEPRRELVYNFPDEYVRKNEIILNQQPVTARFKLVSLSAEAP